DLLGRQAADLAQGQRHLGVRLERRVAAGEDQPQPVVLDILVLLLGGLSGVGLDLADQLVLRGIEAGAAAGAVDGLEAARRCQAGGLVGGPSRAHCSTAAAKAACIASSATSKSPSRRISVASTRRESDR